MPDAVVVAQDEVTLDAAAIAAEAAEDAEFESGFAAEPTVTPPAEEKPAEETPAAEVPAAETPAPETPAAAEVKYRQITETEYEELRAIAGQIEQVRADQRKELDRAFGKVGGVERTLAALQAATPTGLSVEVTDEVVADLKKEYPELGDLVLKSLQSFAKGLKGTSAAAPAAIDPQQIEAISDKRAIALQIEALEDEHPKWREIVGAKDSTNPYRQWLAKQSAEYQAKLGSTNNAAVIARSITRFESDSAAAAAAAKTAADAAAKAAAAAASASATTRKQRLAAAATPKGAGGHTPAASEDDDFESGFKSG